MSTVLNTQPSLPQLRNAYLAIEAKIVLLEFRPGAMLTEKTIIEAVGFGRTPVREALQRLHLEGLVEIHPRLGIKIAEIRPEDYPRAIEPRLTLEPLLARSAARYAGPHDREIITASAQRMVDAAQRNDVSAFLWEDKVLDAAISSAAANSFLPRALSPLEAHSRRFWYHYHGADGVVECAEHHVAACKAIVSGDPERASAAMRELMEYLFVQSKRI
ncbi:GntR family transcriptional regulator [Devosia nitrariae]|nr:GntR family transcriptional regulator [Devosia nitrariae]